MNDELIEKAEEVRESLEEKAQKAKEAVREAAGAAAEKFEEAGRQAEQAREKLHQTLDDLNETLKNDAGEKVASESSGIELTLKPNDAYLAARKEVKDKYGTEKNDKIELKDKVSEKFDQAKKDVADTFGDLKETAMNVGASIGEKSKTAAEKFKETGAGKAILGDDGKFDMDDVGRIGSDILEAGEKAVEKVAGFIKDLTNK